MSKANSIKSDLDDVASLVEIFQILKDVATNQFYNTAKRKESFVRFAESFTDFFRMVNLSHASSYLLHSEVKTVCILPITTDGGFMADATAKVIRSAINESTKYGTCEFAVIGSKAFAKLKQQTDKKITAFTDVGQRDLYETALDVKEFIIEQARLRKFGRVFAVYPRAMSINFIKPVVVKLLPSEELVTKQKKYADKVERVILESNVNSIIHYLADVWLTCRLYEMLEDCEIAGFAAQSQQLESSMEKLNTDKKGMMLAFRKAKRADIDKSLREVFTASMITGG